MTDVTQITNDSAALPKIPASLSGVSFSQILVGSIGGIILFAVAVILAIAFEDSSLAAFALPMMLVAFGLLIWAVIRLFQCLYRSWAIIPADMRRTTPGKAVGFSFIPFFNYYWLFVAYFGWAQDYNAYLDKTGQANVARVPVELFRFYAILLAVSGVTSLVPGLALVGNLAAIAAMIVGLVAIKHMCDALDYAINTREGDNNLLN